MVTINVYPLRAILIRLVLHRSVNGHASVSSDTTKLLIGTRKRKAHERQPPQRLSITRSPYPTASHFMIRIDLLRTTLAKRWLLLNTHT